MRMEKLQKLIVTLMFVAALLLPMACLRAHALARARVFVHMCVSPPFSALAKPLMCNSATRARPMSLSHYVVPLLPAQLNGHTHPPPPPPSLLSPS